MNYSNKSDSDSRNANQVIAPEGRTTESVDTSRRRFTRAGLSGSVLMTLASRPALGAASCSSSGIQSGNLSRPQVTDCFGASPTAWLDYLQNNGGNDGTCGSYGLSTVVPGGQSGDTFEEVLNGDAEGANIAAGYLNVCRWGLGYGYGSEAEFGTFIGDYSGPGSLLEALIVLNGRGSTI